MYNEMTGVFFFLFFFFFPICLQLYHDDEDGHWEEEDPSLPRHSYRKILSDVDDTLFASGGRFPAGIDTSFPAHVIYPGVLSFYRELDLGAQPTDGVWPTGRAGNLVSGCRLPHLFFYLGCVVLCRVLSGMYVVATLFRRRF